MVSLFDVLTGWFAGESWGVEVMEPGVLRAGFRGKNAEFLVFARAVESARQVVVYSRAPMQVPEAKRAAVAELIARANYGMMLGNFELDFDDGEVRYKTSIDVEGGELSPALLRHLVYPNVLTLDKYLPALDAVLRAHATPAAAVAKVEGG